VVCGAEDGEDRYPVWELCDEFVVGVGEADDFLGGCSTLAVFSSRERPFFDVGAGL